MVETLPQYLPPVFWLEFLSQKPYLWARRWAADPQDDSLCSWTYPLFLPTCEIKKKKRHKTINIHPQSRLKQNYTYLKIKQHVNAQFDPTNCVRFFHILNMWHQTLAGKDSKQEHLIWHFIVYVYKMEAFKLRKLKVCIKRRFPFSLHFNQ